MHGSPLIAQSILPTTTTTSLPTSPAAAAAAAVAATTITPLLDKDNTPSSLPPSSPSWTAQKGNNNNTVSSSIPKYDKYSSVITGIPVPAKRGHKYHVASACVNCKKAHLACDESRPCKRCISIGKTSTCLDLKHKKRGRPKLTDKKASSSTKPSATNDQYEVMRGTIQTPTFVTNPRQLDSSASKQHQQSTPPPPPPPLSSPSYSSSSPSSPSKEIQFSHQSVEAFQKVDGKSSDLKISNEIAPIELTPTSPAPSMTRSDSNDMSSSTSSPPSSSSSLLTVTLVLSMEICCARILDNNITKAWGYYPQELAHRSMYDFIAVEDTKRLSRLHRFLLDNVMDMSAQKDSSQQRDAPPPTERTTSELFYQKQPDELIRKANGSQSFNDIIHIKTRTGSKELYEVFMYLGGGLGADLDDASSLTKLYIVMKCQKKDTILEKEHHPLSQQHHWPMRLPHHQQQQQRQRSSFAYKPIAPLLLPASSSFSSSPSSCSSSSSVTNTNIAASTITTSKGTMARPASRLRPGNQSRYAFHGNRPIQPAPHDLRHVSLPAHFANNSTLNTISFRDYQESPKINVAPSTLTLNYRNTPTTSSSSSSITITSSSLSSSPSSSSTFIPSTYFRPIASASLGSSPSSSLSSSKVAAPQQEYHYHLPTSTAVVTPSILSSKPQMPSSVSSISTSGSTPTSPPPPPATLPPVATIAYRYTAQASSGPRESPPVTHPTIQYFLQTSSSTLNAAASATQEHSRPSPNHPTGSSSEITPTRRQGMSIRSLLC